MNLNSTRQTAQNFIGDHPVLKQRMRPTRTLRMKLLTLRFIEVIALLLCATAAFGQTASPAASLATQLLNRPIFPDGLSYVSVQPPSDLETKPLWDLIEWASTGPSIAEQLSSFESFIAANDGSAWTPSVRANLASFYKRRGQFSLALVHWEAAWSSIRGLNTPAAGLVGDYVIGNLTELLARLGHNDRLSQLLQETANRKWESVAWQQHYNAAKDAWHRMNSQPQASFRCGIAALTKLVESLNPNDPALLGLKSASPGENGTSMADLSNLAQGYNLNLQPVIIPSTSELIVPSVVHYQVGHFAAILKKDGNSYLVSDPVFRGPRWIKGDVIQSESSGRYLIPSAQATSQLQPLSTADQALTIGKGYPSGLNDDNDQWQGTGAGLSLPAWHVSEPYLNLWLQSEVLRYNLPGGLIQSFLLTYKQRDTRSTSSAFNFGPSWDCSWLGYVDYHAEQDEAPLNGYTHYLDALHMPISGVDAYDTDSNGNGSTYYNFSKFNFVRHNLVEHCGFVGWTPDDAEIEFQHQQDFAALGQHRAYFDVAKDPKWEDFNAKLLRD